MVKRSMCPLKFVNSFNHPEKIVIKCNLKVNNCISKCNLICFPKNIHLNRILAKVSGFSVLNGESKWDD